VSLLSIAANSGTLGQVQSRPSSRVRLPRSSTGAVVLRSQTALTGSDRPGQFRQREQGRPTCTDETCCMSSGPSFMLFAPADRRWPGRSGSASGSEGQGAVAAARAARRAALKTYRKSAQTGCPTSALHAVSLHAVGQGRGSVVGLQTRGTAGRTVAVLYRVPS
jgi:hypothetical protein